MANEATLSSTGQLALEMAKMRAAIESGETVHLEWSAEKSKTPKQRGALHVWLGQMAKVLNDAGFDKRVWYREHAKSGLVMPWSLYSVKEDFYKPTLAAMTGKGSTEEMNTVEPGEICKIVGHGLQARLGVTPPPWPSRFGE